MITTYIDESLMPSRTQDQKAFDNAVAYVFRNLPAWGREVNATLAEFGALAAGGVYTFQFLFDTSTADADPGNYKVRLSSVTQNASPTLRIDLLAVGGADIRNLFNVLQAITSTIKGSVRLTKVADPAKWMVFDITAVATPADYRNLSVIHRMTGGGSNSPFANGEPVMVSFQLGADKGDTGPLQTQPSAHFRDQRATNGNSDSMTRLNWIKRTLNTVMWNNITGATLGGSTWGVFTLPPGTYLIEAAAPTRFGGGHQARLVNDTSNAVIAYGTSEYNPDANSSTTTWSQICALVTIAASTPFRIEHYINGAAGASAAVGVNASGNVEVYTTVKVTKVG